ncbi:MXAN_6640 family putative metalloprotease [Nocardioides mesophilus]|uniref:Uncharacterized protein n=1 Tax=Nocardioides mesophilus TaxID=433659 RepID=A0A7G9R9K3_9ACTN|nr:MXAN_6640 family putative metalloprotease [Nocardioides mesophilus]QNN52278.1 hypothetical protein H9L09_17600 [Nocardioides mesophilus]
MLLPFSPVVSPAVAADPPPTPGQEALAEAKALFDGKPGTMPQEQGDATTVLLDLAAKVHELDGSQRRSAERLLARPTAAKSTDWSEEHYYAANAQVEHTCAAHVCVTYATNTVDAVALDDSDGNQVPDWVDTTASVAESVYGRIVDQLGYRAPLSDETVQGEHGVDGKLDIYLSDLSDSGGAYGYCTPESDHKGSARTDPGYCVLDNDFVGYGGVPLQLLQVTLAHEFFHAVQFAYDWREDTWLMEGSAAWMEGEVYGEVDDNIQFLSGSQLVSPGCRSTPPSAITPTPPGCSSSSSASSTAAPGSSAPPGSGPTPQPARATSTPCRPSATRWAAAAWTSPAPTPPSARRTCRRGPATPTAPATRGRRSAAGSR